MRTCILPLAVAAALSACGETMPEQALIGAGAGAGTATVLDGSIGLGAVLGAAGNLGYCNIYPGRC